jgi:hypothetical protein
MNMAVGRSQSFHSRDKYAINHVTRNITMIEAVVEQTEQGISIIESSATNSITISEKRASQKNKVKIDNWNMICGNKQRRCKQKPMVS